MKHLYVDDHEKQIHTPERIEVISGPMPSLEDIYDRLSTLPDIRVFSEAKGLRNGSARRDVSEKELVDDLLDFCTDFRKINVDDLEKWERELHEDIDSFVQSIHFMTHEEYNEAVDGLASRHAEWLAEDETRRLVIAVQQNRKYSSQWQVANDLHRAISANDPESAERAEVLTIGDAANSLTESTKILIADDWSASGSLISQDLAHVCQMLNRSKAEIPVEVNLLVAREDQIIDGINSLDKTLDFYGQPMPEKPKVIAYFSTPAVKNVHGHQAVPTGSHSSVDYGFSTTLDAMRLAMDRQASTFGREEIYMPYIGKIIPTYAHNYVES